MDVACKPPCGADRLALQGQIYGELLGACLAQVWRDWAWSLRGFSGRDPSSPAAAARVQEL